MVKSGVAGDLCGLRWQEAEVAEDGLPRYHSQTGTKQNNLEEIKVKAIRNGVTP